GETSFVQTSAQPNLTRRNAPAHLQLLRRLGGLKPDWLIGAGVLLHTDWRLSTHTRATWSLNESRARATGRVGQRRFNAENFQFENERRGRWDFRRTTLFAIGELARDVQFPFIAHVHVRECLQPSRDNAAGSRGRKRTARFVRAIE